MMKDKIIIALDFNDADSAKEMVKTLSPALNFYKVGISLFTSCGPDIARWLKDEGCNVFLDLKFHDIPHSVSQAVRAAAALGVDMIDVHTAGGIQMMQAAKHAIDTLDTSSTKPILLGVTVLTSLNQNDFEKTEGTTEIDLNRRVDHLAGLAKEAGLEGVVASGNDIKRLRKKFGNDFVIVTPGIRPEQTAVNDQQRVITPRQAFEAGADYIVIGRAITQAKDPLAAALGTIEEVTPPWPSP